MLETERTHAPGETKKVNPLDAAMTKAQVVRRKFKSGLPRSIKNRLLSKMEAMARTMELFARFRNEMEAAGLDKSDVKAGLVYCQPQTPGLENVLAEVAVLPNPDKGSVVMFAETTMALDKPLFLGVLFAQTDREVTKPEKRNTIFVWPFMLGPEAEKRLLAARQQQAKGIKSGN
jgi:hypothetical protein